MEDKSINETEFEQKYISTTDKAIYAESTKVVLSDDAFAIGLLLEGIKLQIFRGVKRG